MRDQERDAVRASAVWMALPTVLLFFVPALGGLAGGLAGGWRAGNWRRALRAAPPAALASAVAQALLLSVIALPGFGRLPRTAIFMWVLVTAVALLAGALIASLGAGGDIRVRHMRQA